MSNDDKSPAEQALMDNAKKLDSTTSVMEVIVPLAEISNMVAEGGLFMVDFMEVHKIPKDADGLWGEVQKLLEMYKLLNAQTIRIALELKSQQKGEGDTSWADHIEGPMQ